MKKILCVSLAFVLLLSGCSAANPASLTTGALAEAVYPETVPYPADETGDYEKYEAQYDAWWKAHREQMDLYSQEASMDTYYSAILQVFNDPEYAKKNVTLSPLNIYLMLSLLAESTDGQSRQQILDVLGMDSMDQAREQANLLWRANYNDDLSVTSILANSVWLDQDFSANQDWLERMSKEYYASVFAGDMGSAAFNDTLHAWLDEQTRGKLTEAAQGINFDANTLMALASTIYYKARWDEEFNANQTDEMIFHGAENDQTCRMMHQSTMDEYFYGEHFGAVTKRLLNSGEMVFILPDEGVPVQNLFTDEEALSYMITGEGESKVVMVNLSVPKFDITSRLSLIDSLQELGITDIFSGKADFSPVTKDAIYLYQIDHAARVIVDEEGVEAAAFTVAMAAGASLPPDEEVDFVLDRPFIFLLKGADGQILFAGIVNQVS